MKRQQERERLSRSERRTCAEALVFTPLAWLKLQHLCHLGRTEVGAFAISDEHDPLRVEGLTLVEQRCTSVSVAFEDEAVAEHFDRCVDAGLPPRRFARIWVHTHPGDSAIPSGTDERTFDRVFGRCDWAVMCILARGGETYARLRIRAGGLHLERTLPVRVDYAGCEEGRSALPGVLPLEAWTREHQACVRTESLWAEPVGVGDGSAGQAAAGSSYEAGDDESLLCAWLDEMDEDERLLLLDRLNRHEPAGLDEQEEVDDAL